VIQGVDVNTARGADGWTNATEPPGSHVFVEVQNNLPSGKVACKVDHGLGIGSTFKTRSAQGASIAICDVYLP
jgi:hypothetical protein